jgi:hypothetical protein
VRDPNFFAKGVPMQVAAGGQQRTDIRRQRCIAAHLLDSNLFNQKGEALQSSGDNRYIEQQHRRNINAERIPPNTVLDHQFCSLTHFQKEFHRTPSSNNPSGLSKRLILFKMINPPFRASHAAEGSRPEVLYNLLARP